MANDSKETAEQAAEKTVFFFLSEYIPGVSTNYELLKNSTDEPLKISLADLQAEILVFGLHCLDRAVFSRFGEEYRKAFMDRAFAIARLALASVAPDDHQTSFLAHIDKFYNGRQREYAALNLPTDQNVKGTLFWEFGRRVCEDAGVYNPVAVMDMVYEGASLFRMMRKTVSI